MNRILDFSKWYQELANRNYAASEKTKKYKKELNTLPYATKGVSKVFKLFFTDTDTKDVNWDSFSLEDVKIATSEIIGYMTTEDESYHESYNMSCSNKGNGFHESRYCEWAFSELIQSNNKVYDLDENDFI